MTCTSSTTVRNSAFETLCRVASKTLDHLIDVLFVHGELLPRGRAAVSAYLENGVPRASSVSWAGLKQPPTELDLLLGDVDFGTQRLADEWIGQKARARRKWPN